MYMIGDLGDANMFYIYIIQSERSELTSYQQSYIGILDDI